MKTTTCPHCNRTGLIAKTRGLDRYLVTKAGSEHRCKNQPNKVVVHHEHISPAKPSKTWKQEVSEAHGDAVVDCVDYLDCLN